MTVSTGAASTLAAGTAAGGGGVGNVSSLEDSFWHKVTFKKNAGILCHKVLHEG